MMFTTARRILIRLVPLVALVIFCLGQRGAEANFEVPYLDSTNSVSTGEFRGVWMFNRGYKSPVSNKIFNGFEAYAVGYDTDPTKAAPDGSSGLHKNGLFYYYNGSTWSSVVTPMLTTGTSMHIMNAIVGQTDYNQGNPEIIIGVGEKGRVDVIRLQDEPGNTSYAGKNRFAKVWPPTEDPRDYYAIDAQQTYGGYFMAGGQQGLYARVTAGEHTRLTVTVSGDGGRTTLNADENITGIRYASLNRVFVLTSTFAGNDRYSTNGKNCSGGTQTTRLYKTTDGSSAFQYIGQISPHCGYGIAAGQRSLSNGLENNVVWIATSNGLYRYDEFLGGGIVGPLNGTSGKKLYSVTATPERGGEGVNLLKDGGFETWGGGLPTNWIKYDQSKGRNNGGTLDTGVCATNSRDVSQDAGTGSSGSFAVKIQPGAVFTDNACAPSAFSGGATMAVFTRVDLTSTEGQLLKVSGDYKVSFPTPLPAADTGLSTAAAQGGVSIGCTEANIRDNPSYIGCSYQSRTNIRTIGNPTAGWQHFETIISRNNIQFSNILHTGSGQNIIQPRRMYLEIRCEATFGASVSCDNLQVTEVSNPPLPAQDTFVVSAVGKDRAAVQTTDALAAIPTFTDEQQPVFTGAAVDYLSIFGVSAQHVMAVGESSTLLSRTPSTLRGYIWAGTADQATTGGTTTPAGLGAISVSCINRSDVVGSQAQTLCQQEQSSYGLQLSVKNTGVDAGTGALTGRSWFGKTIGTVSDEEQRSLGSCQRSDVLTDPTNLVGSGAYSSLYDIHGMCNTTARRCFTSRAESRKGFATGALSNYSCLSDFDCYGRCQQDQGTLCVVDNDCTLGASSAPSFTLPSGVAFNPLATSPANKLACTSGTILGCTAVGWLSFDSKDLTGGAATAPDGSNLEVEYNTDNKSHNSSGGNPGRHEFSGWARFLTLANSLDPNYTNSGWVRLRGPNVAAQGKLFSCQDCYGGSLTSLNCAFCRDDAGHSCTPSDTQATASCHYSCLASGNACVTDSDCGTGDSCKPIGYCTGDTSLSCTTDLSCSTAGKGTCALGAQCSTTGSSCQQYGVNMSTETGQFSGYAWSEDFGWLDFRNVAVANSRFFQTKLGDIYAGVAVGNPLSTQPSGVNNCNATFLILSGGTIASNWCSAIQSTASSSGVAAKQPNVTPLQLPSSTNIYRNVLGRFDLVGIERVVSGGLNKYGSRVVPLSPVGTDIAPAFASAIGAGHPLGNRVFTVGDGTTSYSIDSSLVFYASTDLSDPNQGGGAGILVVNGNLTIRSGLSYAAIAGLNDVRKLQNLVIVVKGDLTIDNSVQKIVGSYYVTGTIHTTSSATGSNQYPLEIRGLVIAKDFDLGRKFAGTVENPAPSELIIADGRLQANPMPGMTDFVKALPALTAQP